MQVLALPMKEFLNIPSICAAININTMGRNMISGHSSLDRVWRVCPPVWIQSHIFPAVLCWMFLLQSPSWCEGLQPHWTNSEVWAELHFLWDTGMIRRLLVWNPPGQAPPTLGSWTGQPQTSHWRLTVRLAETPDPYYESVIPVYWWIQTSCQPPSSHPGPAWTKHPWCKAATKSCGESKPTFYYLVTVGHCKRWESHTSTTFILLNTRD